jgi:hypothetical protein
MSISQEIIIDIWALRNHIRGWIVAALLAELTKRVQSLRTRMFSRSSTADPASRFGCDMCETDEDV